MVASSLPKFSVKEYLALEGVAEQRHEFSGGQILAMAGADPAHNTIVHNLHLVIGNALADRPCQIWGSDQRVLSEAAGEYFYPDLVVACASPVFVEPRPPSLTNPQVIVEVLSETTERYDRGDKWSAYRQIPTLTDYVMVSSTKREIDHYQRTPDGSWTLRTISRDGRVTLGNGVELELGALYRRVPSLET